MPPPSVAKIAPHTNATMISHHGSGSKRSAQRMMNRYVSTIGVTNIAPRMRPTSMVNETVAGSGRVRIRGGGRQLHAAGRECRGDRRIRQPIVDTPVLLDVEVRPARDLHVR